MTKRILAAVLLLCLFVSVVYAQSAATVFGWPPADGSVTPAKLSGTIPVANGGTGATTAAAGLAALGGASLNGSATVDFLAKSIAVGTDTPLVGLFGGATISGNNDAGAGELVLSGTDRYSAIVLQAKRAPGFYVLYDDYTGKTNVTAPLGKTLAFGLNFADTVKIIGTQINLSGVLEFANNAAAITGGLVAGDLYHTAGVLKVVTP